MNTNEKISKKYVIAIFAAVVVLFSLVMTLVIQGAVLAHQRQTIKNLDAHHKDLQTEWTNSTDTEKYMLTEDFIDEYALTKLNKGRAGSKVFK
jgi:short subunit fatty acids transporter